MNLRAAVGWTTGVLLAAWPGLLPAAGAAGMAYGKLQFEPCTLASPGVPQTVAARCSRLSVPEDRSHPGGRHISLAIAWVPGAAKRPQPDPVIFLAGGPGQAALESFPMLAGALREVMRQRDVILVDQRGTGKSHPLECPEVAARQVAADLEARDVEQARAQAQDCLREIRDADPRFYTTSDYIDDLEAVRQALGVGQFNVFGVSYGTRVALEYLRRQPGHVRTMLLDSVVPPTLLLGAEHARNLEDAVDAQFARCAADATCRERYGSPRATLDRLLQDLRVQPRKVAYRDPLTYELREENLTVDTVATVVRLHAYVPQLFAMLPMLLADAAAGHGEGLMAQARMVQQLVGEQISAALQLSVSCAEDAPGLVSNPADRDTLLGTEFVDLLRAQCSVWPRGRMPADFHTPVTASRPVLLLAGEFDPVTPPRYGERVQRSLPQSRLFVLRGQGHGVLGVGCTPRLYAEFVDRADVAKLDGRCLDTLVYTPPFAGPYGWEP
ncbi:MAG TPA: alpha/beta hydrolase [Steroidobacteraceae bacterium]